MTPVCLGFTMGRRIMRVGSNDFLTTPMSDPYWSEPLRQIDRMQAGLSGWLWTVYWQRTNGQTTLSYFGTAPLQPTIRWLGGGR